VIVEGEGAVLGVNLGHPIVTNGAFATRSSQITLRTCYLLTYLSNATDSEVVDTIKYQCHVNTLKQEHYVYL